MGKRFILLLLILHVFNLKTSAEVQQKPLTLQEAGRQFFVNNLELIAERYNIEMAEAEVIQAKLFENPVISLEQNVYNRLNGKYFDMGKEGEAVVEIEQLIYIAGQRNKRVRVEKLNKEMAVHQFEEVLRTLKSELNSKFIELYYTEKSLSIYDKEIEYLQQLLEVMKEQNDKGNISLLEKSRIQALLLSLQQERNETSNQLISLQGDMKLLLGLNASETFEPVFDESVLKQIDITSIPFIELNNRLAERPDLKMARTNIQASRANVSLQKSLAFPEVSLKGSYDRAGNFCDNYFAIGLSISIPVFNRNQGNIKSARLSVLQNTSREELARKQAEKELFTSYARLEKAVKLYNSSNYELERDFETIIDGVNTNFRKRNISLLEFIDYYQAYKETCLQLYQTQKDVFLAMEEINTVTGSDVFSY
ncbi:TolC family protein [Parabacteroides faecis]|uniref:Cobalt-zinc-cadmium efflux system outer membrane protein n=1 Tax=Parabacteroides faecis TaxID=1217282 RepID=A0ABR6KQ88_9BACT|nr:TolC family protein [Parabacteroides faecis]MBB4623528.1 cobalt-zinc-cadmium efflux system outer membrane protein [Parabacteroides faecis]MCS2893267.1 TolC family protein [Parabacteroides faecis]UVQ48124.1 TolC family protein [Parabacteroides faecis]GGK00847.1 cation transporter [Parabacteroides faecis]